MPKFNKDFASTILAEAAYFGDKETAKKHNIHWRTVNNYRKRLDDDKELVALFTKKRELLEINWAEDLAPAIMAGIAFLKRAAQKADEKDPAAIHAIAGATKILTTISTTKEILNVRFAARDRNDREAN